MRPQPPIALQSDLRTPERWQRAPELEEWLYQSFILSGSPLQNPEHAHLELARIGCLWTNAANCKGGASIAATAEIPQVDGDQWSKARVRWLLTEWFGEIPDFLLTFDAVTWAQADDTSACALMEHELYHCGQARDQYGQSRFSKLTGEPVWSMRPHDVEEFVGVVRRYGTHTVNPKLRELAEVAQQVPTVARGAIRLACGTCGRVAV